MHEDTEAARAARRRATWTGGKLASSRDLAGLETWTASTPAERIPPRLVARRGHARVARRPWTSTPTSEICWRSAPAPALGTRSSAATLWVSTLSPAPPRTSICWSRGRPTTSSGSRGPWLASALRRTWWTEAVLVRAVHVALDDLDVPMIALDDLIANKRASGRTQDMADVEALEKARSASER